MENMRHMPLEELYNHLGLLYRDKPLNSLGYDIAIKQINDSPIHYDNYVALMFVLKGSYAIKVSFNNYKLKAGDFLLVNPYEIHRLTPLTKNNRILLLKIGTDKLESKLFAFDYGYYNNTNSKAVSKIKNKMLSLYALSHFEEEEVSAKDNELKRKNLFDDIIEIIDTKFQMHEFDVFNQIHTIDKSNSANLERMKNAYEILYFRYGERIRLKDFADSEHIDSFYASRLFKNITGKGFQDNLNTIRVDRAELFILGTNLPIQEISDELGFSSYDYFNKNFKAVFGKSASTYRKQNKPLTYPNKDMNTETINVSSNELKSLVSKLEIEENKDINHDDSHAGVLADLLEDVYNIADEYKSSGDDSVKIKKDKSQKTVTLNINNKTYTLNIKE